ncbi:MAG TPA: alpha/beta hydrolase [Micromonosporaceae bacterium]|nr:alpha/beta hydrolase [Micromonosporaceae bacterium]
MPVAHLNDVRLYYELHGAANAEPLVLICGLGLDISEITSIVDALATGYRVLAFDNRGAGRSDKPNVPYTIDMMAADTAGVMRSAGVPRATVLGMSLGGRIALALALAEPTMVSQLILVSTGPRVRHSWRRRLIGLAARLPIGRSAHPQPRYAFRRQHAASDTYDATDRLGEITVPALILHGRNDKTAPLAIAEDMSTRLPNATLRTFPGGHIFMFLGQRQPFIDAVLGARESSGLGVTSDPTPAATTRTGCPPDR